MRGVRRTTFNLFPRKIGCHAGGDLQQKRGNMSIAASNLENITQTSRTKTKEKVSWWKRMKRESGKDDFEPGDRDERDESHRARFGFAWWFAIKNQCGGPGR